MAQNAWSLASLIFVAALATKAWCQDQPASAVSVSPECKSEMTSATARFDDAFTASDWKGALAIATAAAKVCEHDRLALDMLDTMRADASLRNADLTGVIAILKSPGVSEDSAFWLQSRFIEIVALKKLGMQTEYLAVRDELVAATERQLTGGPQPYMAKVERFETRYAVVDAYEEVSRDRNLREVFFLAAPKDGAMPISVSVSFRMHGGQQGRPLFDMDMTYCQGNELMVTDKKARTYADLKAQASSALDHLLGASDAASPNETLAGVNDGAQGFARRPSSYFVVLRPSDSVGRVRLYGQ